MPWTDLNTSASDTTETSVLMTRILSDFAVADVSEAVQILRDVADSFERGEYSLRLINVAGFDMGRIQATVPT